MVLSIVSQSLVSCYHVTYHVTWSGNETEVKYLRILTSYTKTFSVFFSVVCMSYALLYHAMMLNSLQKQGEKNTKIFTLQHIFFFTPVHLNWTTFL